MVAGDTTPEVDGTSAIFSASPYNEHNSGSVETDDPQGAGQATPVMNISAFGEAPLSIAECSPETLALLTVTYSASNLRKIDEDDLGMIKISNFTTTKVLDKRPGPFGIEYRCAFESWLTVDLVAKAQMGHVRIKCYENELVQARRVGTLREGILKERKRKLSQMEAC
jgi:hypothetical protein